MFNETRVTVCSNMFGHKQCSPEASGRAGYRTGSEAVAADEDLKRRREALLLAQHDRCTQDGEFSIATD